MKSSHFCEIWNEETQQFPGELFLFINKLKNIFESEAPRIIIEIGVAGGHTLKTWSDIVGKDGLVIGIDKKIRPFNVPLNAKLISGSSNTWDVISRLEKLLKGNKTDMLFIDGCHDYEAVSIDFAIYKQYVRDGGVIAFHDIEWGGVKVFFSSLENKKYFVDTDRTLPDNVNALRNLKGGKDYAMSKTNTLGWLIRGSLV